MELQAVQTSYARWAPIYDKTFGAITDAGRRRAVAYMNKLPGNVLEVGVGTGLALLHYEKHLRVTGIDYSDDMLAKAHSKKEEHGLSHVTELRQMDARQLEFADNQFDMVAAMHVLSVVPEPDRVMTEIARVCKPGGKVVITNHFQRTTGVLAVLEKLFAPAANVIGWHSDFKIETVLREPDLKETHRAKLPPVGMMTLLVLEKTTA